MDRHLQDKLQQFSAMPPEGVWQKIADALDAGENIAQRLYQYEEAPPAAAWQKIERGLNETVPVKVVPFATRFRKPLRYAAVAGFLAVVMVTITLTVKRTEAGALDPEKNITVQTNSSPALPPLSGEPVPSANPAGEAISTNPKDQNTAPQNQQDVTTARKENKASNTVIRNQPNKAGPVYSSLNKYVFFSDGDGRLRKVSKKLADFVNCKEDDLKCQQRLKELRQRMAASAMTTDFTGVIELLRQLQ
jgi:hypothetical protein